jgi:RNA polymerase sigma factor (sigma-70 family)
MDHLPPDGAIVDSARPLWPRLADTERPARETDDAAPGAVVGRPLGELLVLMQAERAEIREAAWAECYRRYHEVVWTRVFHVIRSIAWLPEPREVAADVASDIFVGLPDAARHYREQGQAEWWLKQVAVRAALRRKAALTGRWATGKRAPTQPATGRYSVSLDDAADEIVQELDAVEPEELLELERRLDQLRTSPEPTKRRWAEFIALYVRGSSFQEIGAALDLSEGTVRNWLCQIRKYLARPLTAE